MDRSQPMNLRRLFTIAIKTGLTLVVLYFVGRQLAQHWQEIKTFEWQIDPLPLILSIGLGLLALLVFALCWRGVIISFGHDVSVARSFKIAYLSNLGRYVPGKVWQVFGMLYLARKEGVQAEQAAASFVITQILAVPASFLVFMAAGLFESTLLIDRVGIAGQGTAYLLLALSVAGSLVLVFRPEPLVRLANRLLRRLNRPTVSFCLDKKVALIIFVGYVFGWICYGVAFWLFLYSVVGFQAPNPIAATGLFNAAYQIGYLALFAPGGFGPREWVMGRLLEPFLQAIASAVAMAARVWAIVLETLAAILAVTISSSPDR